MVKVLVCGDAEGKLGALFSKVATLNSKHGFDVLFCVGRFATSPTDLSPYVSGASKVPIPTYFLGGDERDAYFVNDLEAGSKICDNLYYAGKAGVCQVQGLNVAFLSGRYDGTAYCGLKGPREDNFTGMYREEDIIALEKAAKGKIIDVLLTNEWPRGTYKDLATPGPVPGYAESPAVADLVGSIQPRYHFAGRGGIFYERPPHHSKSSPHVCRFLGIAKVGNEQKSKWTYAVNISPGTGMSPEALAAAPEGTTPFPFVSTEERPTKRQRNQHQNGQGGRGQGRGRDRRPQHQPPVDPANCWFCIASPDVATHLIVSIGTESYVALPKGGVADEHCLILPITHYRAMPRCTPEVRREFELYTDALRKYYASKNLDMLIFERNAVTRSGGDHMHLQVIPISKKLSHEARAVFESEGERYKMFFRELDADTTLDDAVGDELYFYVEFPNGERLVHVIRPDERHPMQFGIQTTCQALREPEKADWKANALSQDGETVLAERFKSEFQKFDPFLQE